jgi:hypothetical protein
MDDRQVNPQSHQRRQREANPLSYTLLQEFHMVGWRECQALIAEGHYRCPRLPPGGHHGDERWPYPPAVNSCASTGESGGVRVCPEWHFHKVQLVDRWI